MEHITSRQNAHYKQARKLTGSARERRKNHLIVMDGTRLIGAYADQFGLKQSMLLVSEQGMNRSEVREIVDRAAPATAFLLGNALFDDISQIETPEGIVAIAQAPRVPAFAQDDFRILLNDIQDPGNLGGLLRTAAAAGATSAHLSKGCADAYSPKALRGGMGAQFVLPVREQVDLAASIDEFAGTVICTSARANQTIYDIVLSGPVAMVFGNEGKGLPEELLALANQLVSIPMAGKMESLNVAASAAICCFERLRQVHR